MKGSPQEAYLGYWAKMVYHAMAVNGNRLLRPYGLTTSSWYVLYHITKAGRITQKALQETLGIESGSMAMIVDALVRKGWLERSPSEKDRRVNTLRLTPKGLSRWKAVPDVVSISREEMTQGISPEEEEAAVEALKKCWSNLSKATKIGRDGAIPRERSASV